MAEVAKKIASVGNENIMLCERGVSFGYHNLVNDMRSLPIMAQSGYPVVFDATHSVQMPGAGGSKSSGDRRFVPFLARAAGIGRGRRRVYGGASGSRQCAIGWGKYGAARTFRISGARFKKFRCYCQRKSSSTKLIF